MELDTLIKAQSELAMVNLRSSVASISPPEPVNIWLPKFRVLRSGAITGAYDPDFFPPVRAILDAITSGKYYKIVLKAGVQSGKTEALINALLWYVSQKPANIIWLVPRDKDQKTIMKGRIKPSLKQIPEVSSLVSRAVHETSRVPVDNQIIHNGSYNISTRFAGTSMELASTAASVLFADEVDKYQHDIRGSGDPISMLDGRSINYYDSVMVLASSPTSDYDQEKGTGSLIEKEFLSSDQRLWECQCTRCGKYDHWTFAKNVRWTRKISRSGKSDVHEFDTAHIRCTRRGCGNEMRGDDMVRAMRNGRWTVHNKSVKGVAGFTWSRLIFPITSLPELCEQFIRAKANVNTLKTFKNEMLAEVFEHQGFERIKVSRTPYEEQNLKLIDNPDVLYLTIGVDVQGDRLECIVVGHGTYDRSYILAWHTLEGEPETSDEPWLKLDKLRSEIYQHPAGHRLFTHAIGIDSGYMTTRVYDYAISKRDLGAIKKQHVFVVKGEGNADAYGTRPFVSSPSTRHMPRKKRGKLPLRDYYRGLMVYNLGTNQGKNELSQRIRLPKGKARSIRVGEGLSDAYIRQLEYGERVQAVQKNGRVVYLWRPFKGRNDALDATLYAIAAKTIMKNNSKDRELADEELTKFKLKLSKWK